MVSNTRILETLSLAILTSPAIAAVVTITASPTIPSTVPQYTDEAKFTSAILNSTNFYRDEYNASALVWNTTLEHYASEYVNSTGDDCTFEHSGGPYGENLAKGYPNATASVEAWGNEGEDYNFKKPGFSEDTGHFSQLVWKNTTDVGCGRKLCGTSGWYVVCEYWPAGNVIGQFDGEVDKPVSAGGRNSYSDWMVTAALLIGVWAVA
ncbi:CAP domain-containing protein [Xylariaceae sp. FL1019]|nr:CAP domain-containing protein [Xylariaceae sp. FL1019]